MLCFDEVKGSSQENLIFFGATPIVACSTMTPIALHQMWVYTQHRLSRLSSMLLISPPRVCYACPRLSPRGPMFFTLSVGTEAMDKMTKSSPSPAIRLVWMPHRKLARLSHYAYLRLFPMLLLPSKRVQVIDKMNRIVDFVHRSPAALNKLHDAQKSSGLSESALPASSPTRWWATTATMQAFVKNKAAVKLLCAWARENVMQEDIPIFTAYEWMVISCLEFYCGCIMCRTCA